MKVNKHSFNSLQLQCLSHLLLFCKYCSSKFFVCPFYSSRLSLLVFPCSQLCHVCLFDTNPITMTNHHVYGLGNIAPGLWFLWQVIRVVCFKQQCALGTQLIEEFEQRAGFPNCRLCLFLTKLLMFVFCWVLLLLIGENRQNYFNVNVKGSLSQSHFYLSLLL